MKSNGKLLQTEGNKNPKKPVEKERKYPINTLKSHYCG